MDTTTGDLGSWLSEHFSRNEGHITAIQDRDPGTWIEVRLFISSTFVDTHAERDILVKQVIPRLNRLLAPRCIRFVPVDLRWGVLAEESQTCVAIQKTCLNQVDKCRQAALQTPWFLGIRTDRYGWVQNELMPSSGFENPQYFKWLDMFEKSGKNLSITSLECIHAVQSTKSITPFPTVFFYERRITNPYEIEENLQWVFEFEYVATNAKVNSEVKYQYSKTENASEYQQDLKMLNSYLKSLKHTKWSEYSAVYAEGGAKVTFERANAKSFGVGYVSSLEMFREMVELHLMEAIDSNFKVIDSSRITKSEIDNIQHESIIKVKASSFVGRSDLCKIALDHCSAKNVKENVMIIHGEPGCGKSGLLAAVTQNCLMNLRESGNFIFVHVVDSCPGSNTIEGMLRRLQISLRKYRRDLGDINLSSDSPNTASELKRKHHEFLEESAREYPNKSFVIIVDAVNQFHEGLQAWKMWWLPGKSCPPNLRFMITTLNEENGTFKHACEVCPDAVRVPVGVMSHEDLQEMVTATLLRFNKKLTTNDDCILGNQMELLLSKSKSPLYLIAACEALRKFGIFEKVSEYISKFPASISSLFSFLLDEWSEEYGQVFTEDIAGLLCVSKDGLLENQVNDLLRFKENKVKGHGEFLYEASFSRIYDSLSSFLAAGGGGYLRFFHDQLKYAVRRKFLSAGEVELHSWLSDFFLMIVQPQLCEHPSEDPPDYYDHALQQLVFHQLATITRDEQLVLLKKSLRNIYFIRERVKKQQQQDLLDEYDWAIKRSNVDSERKALKQWAKFVQLYTPSIAEFPEFCYNMAINQAPTSCITQDTNELLAPESYKGYPLFWTNIPPGEDAMVVKYKSGGVDISASTPKGDVCCIATTTNVVICDQSSGEVHHELNVQGYSVCLSPDFKALWVGEESGQVSLWDVSTGTMKSCSKVQLDSVIVWIGYVGENIACGTGWKRKAICWDDNKKDSTIAIFGMDCNQILCWSTKLPGYSYCFHTLKNMIFSGHKGVIKGWDLTGNLLMTLQGAGKCVYSLSPHPSKDLILSGSNDLLVRQWSISEEKLNFSIKDTTSSGWAFGGNWDVQYDHTGERIFSTEAQSQSLRIYDLNCVLQYELKGHSACINKIVLVPGSNLALTSDRGGESIMWNLPNSSEATAKATQEIDEVVLWCDFLIGGDEFATASADTLRIWTTASCTPRVSVKISGMYNTKGAVHPKGNLICVSGKMDLFWFTVEEAKHYYSFKALKTDDGTITDIKISPDGTKILVTECRNSYSNESIAVVFDITNPKKKKERITYRDHEARVFACDIHPDNVRAATSGHSGTRIWNMESGETLFSFERGCFFVKFFAGSENLLYADGRTFYTYNMKEDIDQSSYKGHTDKGVSAQFMRNESQIVTSSDDGVIRIFDVSSEKCLYAFFNHRAQQYRQLAVHPSEGIILVGNANGMLYMLKTKRE